MQITDVDAAHREALTVNRTRDRLDRWMRSGGLSLDPLRRLRADYGLSIEAEWDARLEQPLRLGITGV